MKIKNFIWGLIGGFCLYIPFVFQGYAPYLFGENILMGLLLATIIGALISATTILIKSKTLKDTLVRTIVMLFSHFLIIRQNGQIGTLRYIDSLFGIIETEASGRVSGLLMALFICAIIVICIITNIAFAIKQLITKSRDKRKTGDGSLS